MTSVGIVTVEGEFDLTLVNNVGGTSPLPCGTYRVHITRAWRDYEIGGRGAGRLVDDRDKEIALDVARTPYGRDDYVTDEVFFPLDRYKGAADVGN